MQHRLLKLLDGLHVQQARAVWPGDRDKEGTSVTFLGLQRMALALTLLLFIVRRTEVIGHTGRGDGGYKRGRQAGLDGGGGGGGDGGVV
ncbi:hypothetical protein EYF80_044888 [Liparis tanakae]|uniref:Uncharacterized protein n=1 Tax=Liparis tanakae TaxID=230148 RepID=A0A4Z2FWE3_9TELE|nr:hypothetical protein EYF80_044888 [Liparis tanakae]